MARDHRLLGASCPYLMHPVLFSLLFMPYLVLPSQFYSGMSVFLLVVWVMQGNARL